ncbi:immunoglobulin-like domain-containing protein [Brevibacillus dissolubilis]|uniref:immunoglobulin-like domain-containing protein n=1 Tax=Brevibacillus dissolubilis TaxID=1844116 RepID=UPI0011164FBF|nr:immunoglobulin-like domain-containing protein [Brevibacillus dissolubilis]
MSKKVTKVVSCLLSTSLVFTLATEAMASTRITPDYTSQYSVEQTDKAETVKIKSVQATNGLITVELTDVPEKEPQLTDFSFSCRSTDNSIDQIEVTGLVWDEKQRKALVSFKPLESLEKSTNLIIQVGYNGYKRYAKKITLAEQGTEINKLSLFNPGADNELTVASKEDASVTLLAVATAKNGQIVADARVEWSSDNTGVATVDEHGVVQAVGAGTARITSTADGKSASLTIKVRDAVQETQGIAVTNGTIHIKMAGQWAEAPNQSDFTFTQRVDQADAKPLAVDSFDWDGGSKTVTATFEEIKATQKEQTVEIGVTYKNSATQTGTFVIAKKNAKVDRVEITNQADDTELSAGSDTDGHLLLTAVAKDKDGNQIAGKEVSWKSSDESVATVNQNGLVTAKGAGSAVITATIGGRTAKLTVTVKAGFVPQVSLGTPVLQESALNDGSVDGQQFITLSKGTFAEDISGADVSVRNLPAGLGIHVARVNDSMLAVNFTGRAVSHSPADSRKDVQFVISKAKIVNALEDAVSPAFSIYFTDPVVTDPGDTQAPQLVNATASEVEQTVTFTFDEPVVNHLADEAALKASIGVVWGDPVVTGTLTANDTVQFDGNKLIIRLAKRFTGDELTIKIPAGTIQDEAGNANTTTISKGFTFPTPLISDVRSKLNDTVTIEGIITADNTAIGGGKLSTYMQDETGGINIFAMSTQGYPELRAGDRVRVTGKISEYRSLTEIMPTAPTDVIKLGTGNPIPTPLPMTILDMQHPALAEPKEGMLIQTQGYLASIPTSESGGGYNLNFIDEQYNGITVRVIKNSLDLAQLQAGKWYDLTGILSQFADSYQIVPRQASDFQLSAEQKPQPKPAAEYTSTVKDVVDGDTIHLNSPVLGITTVRFVNTDTPETYHITDPAFDYTQVYQGSDDLSKDRNQKAHGERAKQNLKALLAPGDEVVIKVGPSPVDGYGRLLAQVIRKRDMLNTNLEQVRTGFANMYFIAPISEEDFALFSAATREAMQNQLGIWNPADPLAEMPFVFRARERQEPPTRFVGNHATKQYVLPALYDQVPQDQRVFFGTEEEATQAGYTAYVDPSDVTPPAAPTVDPVFADATSVKGKAEAGSTVTVKRGATVLGTANADSTGSFTVTLNAALTSGDTLSITATDAAGNTSTATSITVEATAPSVPTIAAVRALPNNSTVTTKGIVTTQSANSFYIQDGTAGIYVYNPKVKQNVQVGDQVTINTGTKTTYSGLVEITNAEFTVTGQTTAPTGKEVSLSEVGSHQSMLVTVKGVTVSGMTSTKFNVTKDGTTHEVYLAQYGVSNAGLADGDVIDLTGISSMFNSKVQIYPRSAADIVKVDGGDGGGGITDAQAVANAKAVLSISYDGMQPSITLPTAGADSTTVSWAVKDPSQAVIINTGTGVVNRNVLTENTLVTLVATITKGTATDTKEFTFTVYKVNTEQPTVNPITASEATVTGTARAGSLVNVYTGETLLGSALADAVTGAFAVTITPQEEGTVLEVIATDAATSYTSDPTYVLVQAAGTLTDQQAVSLAKAALTDTTIRKDNTGLDNVTSSLNLPTTGINGTAISWASSDTATVSTTGSIKRPLMGQPDATITLTATITRGSYSETKTFTVIIKAQTTPLVVERIDNITSQVEKDTPFTLPTQLTALMSDGTTQSVAVTWTPGMADTSVAGTYTFEGTVENYASKVQLTLKVNDVPPALTVGQAKASPTGTIVTLRGYLTSKTALSNTNTVFVIADQADVTDFTNHAGAIQIPQSSSYYTNTAFKDLLMNAEVNSYVEISGKVDTYNSKPSIETVSNVRVISGPTPPANTAPYATNVSISGTAEVGQTLTGTYSFVDAEADAEGQSSYVWYRKDGATTTPIDGATGKTYTVSSDDAGKSLIFEVTPKASTGTAVGQAVKSAELAIPAGNPGDPASHTGVVTFDKAQYGLTDTATVTVTDLDLNLDPAAADTTVASVASAAAGQSITLTLTETGNDTGVFTGAFTLSTTTTDDATDQLQTAYSDTLTATYTDAKTADNQLNKPIQTTATTIADPDAPTIDKTALTTAITSAQTLHDNAVEGSLAGQYETSKATLLSAISNAQAVKDSPAATQTDVDDATTALNAAVNTFLAGKVHLNEGFTSFTGSGTTYADWTMNSIATYTSAGNFGTSSPSLKFDSLGDYVVSPEFTLVSGGTVSFWIKNQASTATSNLVIEGYNGTEWVNITTMSAGGTGNNLIPNTAAVRTFALTNAINKIRFTYNKSGSGNVSVDDIKIKG